MRHAPSVSRQLSGGPGFLPQAPFWGAMSSRQTPWLGGRARGGDVFDHFDEFVNRSFEHALAPWAGRRGQPENLQAIWQPKFDVSEVDDTYKLRGELPGVDASNLDVQFTDEKTLVISGKTASEQSEGTAPQEQQATADTSMTTSENAATEQAVAEAAEKDNDAASVHSDSSYVKPSVEDEADVTARENGTETTSTAGAATPNTDNTVAAPQPEASQPAAPEQPAARYWVSERSVGSFQRTFSFPGRIDAENVTASLKNGILDITVPKAKAPEARKINIQ